MTGDRPTLETADERAEDLFCAVLVGAVGQGSDDPLADANAAVDGLLALRERFPHSRSGELMRRDSEQRLEIRGLRASLSLALGDVGVTSEPRVDVEALLDLLVDSRSRWGLGPRVTGNDASAELCRLRCAFDAALGDTLSSPAAEPACRRCDDTGVCVTGPCAKLIPTPCPEGCPKPVAEVHPDFQSGDVPRALVIRAREKLKAAGLIGAANEVDGVLAEADRLRSPSAEPDIGDGGEWPPWCGTGLDSGRRHEAEPDPEREGSERCRHCHAWRGVSRNDKPSPTAEPECTCVLDSLDSACPTHGDVDPSADTNADEMRAPSGGRADASLREHPPVDIEALRAILAAEEEAADPTKTAGPRRLEASERARRLRAALGHA